MNINIIAHQIDNVNISIMTPAASRYNGTLQKWGAHKADAVRMAEKIRAAHLGEGRAARMRSCGDSISLRVCPECGRAHIEGALLCRDRLCPLCTWRLAMKRFAKMSHIMNTIRQAYPDAGYMFVTLTVRNVAPYALEETLKEMSTVWRRISNRRTWKATVTGCARSLEITYNAEKGTLHPHYHIIVMYQGDKPDVADMWLDGCIKSKLIVSPDAQDERDISAPMESIESEERRRRIDETAAAILETYKYTVKGSDLDEMPLSTFKSVAYAIEGKRLVAMTGKIKEYAAKLKIDMEQDDEGENIEREVKEACEECGNDTDMLHVVGNWCGNGYVWRSVGA